MATSLVKKLVLARSGARPGLLVSLLALSAAGCGGSAQGQADWPPLGKKWFDRAEVSYRQGDIEDANSAIENALRVMPNEPDVRLLAARIALAELEYERSIQLLAGLDSSAARSVRGRSYWYAGKLDLAAEELERLVADPEVRDVWATNVAKLARRGQGRKPFQLSGGPVAVAEMPQVASTALVVPLEVNGEPALGMIATAKGEAVIDAGRSGEPSWISLRFGEKIEVRDVPAMAEDLSGLSRQLNAPIKVLIGINLLRHLHATFDFSGSQFVVRTYEPPPPPHATTVPVSYVRGGGMLLRGSFGPEQDAPTGAFLVDTSMNVPVALDDGGWKRAGVATSSLTAIPNMAGLRQGLLPMLRLGAFEVPRIPGVHGAPVAEFEKGLDVELDGVVGSGLLAAFRVTLADRGRTMWLEDMPAEAVMQRNAPLSVPTDLPSEDVEAAEESDPSEGAAPPAPGKKPKTAPKAAPPSPGPAPAPPSKPGPGGPGSGGPGSGGPPAMR